MLANLSQGREETDAEYELCADDKPVRMALLDSSEQNGTDWLISCYFEIAAKDILPLSCAIDSLTGLRRTAERVKYQLPPLTTTPDELHQQS